MSPDKDTNFSCSYPHLSVTIVLTMFLNISTTVFCNYHEYAGDKVLR